MCGCVWELYNEKEAIGDLWRYVNVHCIALSIQGKTLRFFSVFSNGKNHLIHLHTR